MSGKINVFGIIVDHVKTLSDTTGKLLKLDIFVFYVIPFLFGILSVLVGYNLSDDVVSMLVNFGSIFTALLLSVLMLVYEQRNRLDDRNASLAGSGGVPFYPEKKLLLDQLYSNISYAVVLSMFLVLFSFAHSICDGKELSLCGGWFFNYENRFCAWILTPILMFLATNLILTIFMIVKRTYALLTMRLY